MIAASEPKMKKSYHSKTVPAAEAATTRPMLCLAGACVISVSPLSASESRGGPQGGHGTRRRNGNRVATIHADGLRETAIVSRHLRGIYGQNSRRKNDRARLRLPCRPARHGARAWLAAGCFLCRRGVVLRGADGCRDAAGDTVERGLQ